MNKKLRTTILFLSTLSLLIASCGPGQLFGPTLTPTPTSTLTPTLTPTATPTPTATSTPIPTPTSTTGRIEGRVFQSDTDRSFAGATVSLDNGALDPKDPNWEVAQATTDADGKYVFEDVAPGKYTLTILIQIKNASDMPCTVSILGSTKDEQWLLVTLQLKTGGAALMATQTHVENNAWTPTIFDVNAGDVVTVDADLACS